MKAVITVMGKDTTGIIAKVSNVLFEVNVNILDISQTTMQGLFTMIMMADISSCNVDFSVLSDKLGLVGEEIGMQIVIQHEDIFNSMHKI
ncbi:MAG: ACT domain-containing protein [Oscillospiraceae bacterium]|nr:ACT domain-containing protein [Oscillospiraceae bacterium]